MHSCTPKPKTLTFAALPDSSTLNHDLCNTRLDDTYHARSGGEVPLMPVAEHSTNYSDSANFEALAGCLACICLMQPKFGNLRPFG